MKEELPCNIEAEQSVIASCLLNSQAASAAVREIGHDDFYRESHRLIFAAVEQLIEAGAPVDHITVAEKLAGAGLLDKAGGKIALVNVCYNTFALVNWSYHVEIVKRWAVQRSIIRAATLIIAMASAPDADAEELKGEALRLVLEATGEGGRQAEGA